MPRWNIQTIIAGVDFSLCRAVILNRTRFATEYAGSSSNVASGGTHEQRVRRDGDGVAGIHFGVHMERAEAEALNTLRAAIQGTEAAAQAFRVQLQDAQYIIDVWAVTDYTQDTWLSDGDESEGIIENVTMSFIAKARYV